MILLSVPAFLVALQFAVYRYGLPYIEGEGPTGLQQAVLYTHLFLGLLYVGASQDEPSETKRRAVVIALTIAPRLLIALFWGRFFVAQAIVPLLFIAVARGWLHLRFKRLLQVVLLGLFILFVPALTRGDLSLFGESGNSQVFEFLSYMRTLSYFQDHSDLPSPCPPLLVSLTAKIIPYRTLGLCTTDVGDDKNMPATTDWLLTREYSNDPRAGTGGNYLLELYQTGGLWAIFIGSAIFGFTCRRFVGALAHRSLFVGIWAECLSRALFAPRGNLGYVYEKIPVLMLATLAVVVLSWAVKVLGDAANRAYAARGARERHAYELPTLF